MKSKKLTTSPVAVADGVRGFVNFMKTNSVCLLLAVAGLCMAQMNASAQPVSVAGTYKHITIDGDFSDWAGVPLANNKPDVGDTVSFENLYVANDDDYIYLRFSLYRAANPFTSSQNIFIDVDNSATIGYAANGLGSEMLIQSGSAYRETNGVFNAGGITQLSWQQAPAVPASEYEARISRHSIYAGNVPVFTNNDMVTFILETSGTGGNKWFPNVSGGLQYSFATAPAALGTNVPLVDATSTWKVNDTGSDFGTNWLDLAYDDSSWNSGLGLFGYTPSPGAYPSAIQTSLSSSPNTYYFRTHFNFTNNAANLAFVVTNELSDGAVYYLNGAEVKRTRMAAGPVAYADSATGTNSPEGAAKVFAVPGGALLSGDNILEVETHQAPGSSADMVFGLTFTAASQYPVTIQNTNLPADVSVVAGQSTTFTSDVFGSGPLSYQWYKNGTAIADATNASYTIPLVLTNDAGSYTLAVTNSMSTNITRAAVLTVNSTPVVIDDATQPADQYIVQGRPVTFSVYASGSALVQYQWYNGANPIQDATNSSYIIPAVAFTSGGTYYAMVSNPTGPVNSRTATLTVLADTIAPAVTNITGTTKQVVITFSEPVDATSAANVANYTLSGGISFNNAVVNGQTVTLTTASALTLGTIYTVNINGVKDLYGNAAHIAASVVPTISIDGDMSDWAGIQAVYDNPTPGNDGAADFKDIYVYNDTNYYYFRVTLWHDIPAVNGCFPRYANMFFDTDNNNGTGYSAIGSEFLNQSGFFYQERGGTFSSEGQVLINMAAGYLIAPTTPASTFPADFEFRLPRNAQFSDGAPVFSTNVLNFLWQGQTPAFVVANTASINNGVISYTNVVDTALPTPPLGGLSISQVPSHNVAVTWDTPATLQSVDSLNNTWTNVPAAAAPYITPQLGSQFFRLSK